MVLERPKKVFGCSIDFVEEFEATNVDFLLVYNVFMAFKSLKFSDKRFKNEVEMERQRCTIH